jgi:hypothetical protein
MRSSPGEHRAQFGNDRQAVTLEAVAPLFQPRLVRGNEHRVGALIEDPFLVRRWFAADIDDERQVTLRQVAADAVDKILAELSLLAQQAHPFRRCFLAPVAFAIGAGAQHIVLNLQRAQSPRQ